NACLCDVAAPLDGAAPHIATDDGSVDSLKDWWRAYLRDAPHYLALPLDSTRPPIGTGRGASQAVTLPDALVADISTRSREERVSPFLLLLSAFQLVMHERAKQLALLVGVPLANRPAADDESLIGHFTNTIVIRTTLGADSSFIEFLRHCRESF